MISFTLYFGRLCSCVLIFKYLIEQIDLMHNFGSFTSWQSFLTNFCAEQIYTIHFGENYWYLIFNTKFLYPQCPRIYVNAFHPAYIINHSFLFEPFFTPAPTVFTNIFPFHWWQWVDGLRWQKWKQDHSDIGPSAYFAKLGKKMVNKEKEIEKDRK